MTDCERENVGWVKLVNSIRSTVISTKSVKALTIHIQLDYNSYEIQVTKSITVSD